MTTVLWLAAGTVSNSDPLLNYGAVGLLAALALVAVRFLYKAQITALKEQLTREIARADRLETELAKVNEGVLTQARSAVDTATSTVTDALRRLGGEERP